MEDRPGGDVNDPRRWLAEREVEAQRRISLWNKLGERPDEQVILDRDAIINCWHHTFRLAEALAENWLWLLQTEPEVQSRICKWRLRWQKAWKRSQHGVKEDATLLPAAWSRISNILYNSPYPVSELGSHAAAIINLDAEIWDHDTIWTDFSKRGMQEPIDGTHCGVYQESRLDKPSRFRTPRSQKSEQPPWAVPQSGASQYHPYRYLRSKRPEEIQTDKDHLSKPFIQTSKGRFDTARIYKTSSKREADLTRV